jgi:hypothetical protein
VVVFDVGRLCAVVDASGRAIYRAEFDTKVIAVASSLPQQFLWA